MWETPFFLVFRVVVCRVLYSQSRVVLCEAVIVFVCGKLVSCPGIQISRSGSAAQKFSTADKGRHWELYFFLRSKKNNIRWRRRRKKNHGTV